MNWVEHATVEAILSTEKFDDSIDFLNLSRPNHAWQLQPCARGDMFLS